MRDLPEDFHLSGVPAAHVRLVFTLGQLGFRGECPTIDQPATGGRVRLSTGLRGVKNGEQDLYTCRCVNRQSLLPSSSEACLCVYPSVLHICMQAAVRLCRYRYVCVYMPRAGMCLDIGEGVVYCEESVDTDRYLDASSHGTARRRSGRPPRRSNSFIYERSCT